MKNYQETIKQLKRIYGVEINSKEDLERWADKKGVSVKMLMAESADLDRVLKIFAQG